MSSFSENNVPGSDFLPPESAQVPKSLFGGPSSDVLQPSSQPERSRSSLFGGPSAQDTLLGPIPESDMMDETSDQVEYDHDMLMPERPLASDFDSNEEGLRASPHRGRRRSRRNYSSQAMRSSPPAGLSQTTLQTDPEPIHYVVDRGLDLPPGTERPNLFQGAASSWRRYNADEIGACTAMITERSRDLGAHLYNAHAIRRRIRDSVQNKTETNEKKTFAVPRRWTVWPVPAAQVPRLDERLHNHMDETGSMRMAPDPRPSAGLEESITAVLLKAAKNKYRAREWDYEDVKSDLDKRIHNKDDMMAEELEKKEYGRPLNSTTMEPMMQADDDKSTKQLRPLARNVITQLDKLLYGLHCAMKGRKYDEESGAEHSSEEDEADRTPRKKKNENRSESRGRKRVRNGSPRKQQRPLSVNAQELPEKDTETALPDPSEVRDSSCDSIESLEGNHYIKGRLQLRDWSEVMGLASMMGLPSTAVTRASKRCADLFGEDMEFHTMAEGRVKKKRNNDDQWVYTYTESDSDDESAPATPQPKSRAKSKKAYKPRSEPKATTKKYRPKKAKTPAIVPPSASTSPVPEATMIREPAPSKEPKRTRPGLGKGDHRKLDIVCPFEGCSRHTKGFSRTWNLNQHLKKAHPSYALSGNERSQSRAGTTREDEDLIQVD
ncbi:unnamed protein product [Penicillium olsonii]|nr:unnamed protein product [Penicillium olsonii]CAG7928068.1 unnamed protein product [Penicillium olsonii]